MLLVAVFAAFAAVAAVTIAITVPVAWTCEVLSRRVHLWRIETGRIPSRITY